MDQRDVAAIPLFAGLSKDDQKVVAQYADEVDVSAGTKLAQEGRFAYEFFAIKDGTAEVTKEGQRIADLGPAPDDEAADEAILRLAAACGGTISAEHGVGVAKARWLSLARSPAELRAMAQIKRALDPDGILNPGAVLPTG